MRRPAGLLALGVLFALATVATATLTGDEDFGTDVSGNFYVFADQVVHVVEPVSLTVIKNLTTDSNGSPLNSANATGGSSNVGRTWNDVAFVEDRASKLRYVGVNEGNTYTSDNGNTQYGYVSIIDAVRQQFVSRLRVGARPVHIYAVNQTNTLWSHSDAEGIFYIIPLNNTNNISVSKTVKAFVNRPGHGKLVINKALYPVGYASNVAEPFLPKFNLLTAANTNNLQYNTSLPDPSVCTGTHTIVYSRVNQHLLAECTDGAGTLEWNTVMDTFVALHTDVVGVVTGSPADDIIFVGDKENSNATLLRPGANGQPSTVFATLQVPYNPDYPVFYSNSSNDEQPGNFTDYTIFFPLTRNTNINNIRAAGSANVTTVAYMTAPSDCQYTNSSSVSTNSASSTSRGAGLTLASAANGSAMTPSCGACAPGINSSDPSQFNASLSGFGVLDLATYSQGVSNTSTTLLPAGANLPAVNRATGANQCSFSTGTYRTARRGGAFVGTVADFPQSSIYLVDASSNSDPVYGFVRTANRPTKLVWVPASTSS